MVWSPNLRAGEEQCPSWGSQSQGVNLPSSTLFCAQVLQWTGWCLLTLGRAISFQSTDPNANLIRNILTPEIMWSQAFVIQAHWHKIHHHVGLVRSGQWEIQIDETPPPKAWEQGQLGHHTAVCCSPVAVPRLPDLPPLGVYEEFGPWLQKGLQNWKKIGQAKSC